MSGEYLLSIKGVAAKVSLSASRIYELVQEGAFPLPCGVGGASRWRGADVDAWILEVAAQPRKVRTVSGLGQSPRLHTLPSRVAPDRASNTSVASSRGGTGHKTPAMAD